MFADDKRLVATAVGVGGGVGGHQRAGHLFLGQQEVQLVPGG